MVHFLEGCLCYVVYISHIIFRKHTDTVTFQWSQPNSCWSVYPPYILLRNLETWAQQQCLHMPIKSLMLGLESLSAASCVHSRSLKMFGQPWLGVAHRHESSIFEFVYHSRRWQGSLRVCLDHLQDYNWSWFRSQNLICSKKKGDLKQNSSFIMMATNLTETFLGLKALSLFRKGYWRHGITSPPGINVLLRGSQNSNFSSSSLRVC